MRIPLCVLAGITALAISGPAQTGGASFSGRLFYSGTVVTGAPYSAERIVEHARPAAGGTLLTSGSQHETVYRDSQGRTRVERPLLPGPDAPPHAPIIVEIRDSVAHVGYVLDTQHKIAHRVALEFARAAGPRSSRVPPQAQESSEDLGQQLIEGVAAQGRRVTHIWPAGKVVSESWFSPEIQEVVLSRLTDPRLGGTTVKLIHITVGQPDPSLFLPPPDYTIVNETGPFQIEWTAAEH